MTSIATKIKVGTAACAVAAAASLTSVATAEASPVAAVPAAPVFASTDAPQGGLLWWGHSKDLRFGFFKNFLRWGCYNHHSV